jgi:hypothetical protein
MKYWVTTFDRDYHALVSREIMEFVNEDEAKRYAKTWSWTGEDVYVTKVEEKETEE